MKPGIPSLQAIRLLDRIGSRAWSRNYNLQFMSAYSNWINFVGIQTGKGTALARIAAG
jgi:hypothetical protein